MDTRQEQAPPTSTPVTYEALQARRRPHLGPVAPARLRRVKPPRLWQELVLILAGYYVYGLVRNGVPDQEGQALRRAQDILSLERSWHIDIELTINKAVASIDWLAYVMNYYYATLHFIVTIAVLVWLYRSHPLRYRPARTVLISASTVGLLGFWFYALAPPRMLTSDGFIDTVVAFHTWGSWGTSGVASHSNQFAAMPSLHIAWSLWCGITIAVLARRHWLKALGIVYPLATLFVIMATANHFVLDAVGGVVVLLAGYAFQHLLSGRGAYLDPTTVPGLVATPRTQPGRGRHARPTSR